MNRSHNKKRNVGIVFEQLVKYASQAVVENNDKVAEKVLKITNKSRTVFLLGIVLN